MTELIPGLLPEPIPGLIPEPVSDSELRLELSSKLGSPPGSAGVLADPTSDLDSALNSASYSPFTSRSSKSRIRHQKLLVVFIGYIIVLSLLALVQYIAVGIFTLGFLLSRDVLPHVAQDLPPIETKRFEKAIIIVVDALRFDFAIPVPGSTLYFHNGFPVLHDLATLSPNAALLKFIADPPTTTLQRLKGLTTGSLPTFIDAGSNFNGDAIDEDNWLLQLALQKKRIAFMGDDTWDALFSKYFAENMSFPFPSLNVWDLHTVDNGVIDHLFPLLDNQDDWDVLIGHFLGVDHVGHRYGPSHFLMKDKLAQMNDIILKTIDKMDNDTLLVVLGDHGMDHTGNHGGDSPDELELTLFLYSKNERLNKGDDSQYDTSDLGKNYRQVNQIDLVPTLSLLLGMPIPYNNLGFPIDEAFKDDEQFAHAAFHVAHQLGELRTNMPSLSLTITSKYIEFAEKYPLAMNLSASTSDSRRFQQESLAECKRLWAQFDMVLIAIGLAVAVLALSFLFTYSRSIPSVLVSTMLEDFITLVFVMICLGLVASILVYIVMRPIEFGLAKSCLVGIASGIIIGFWAPVMDRFSVQWLYRLILEFFVYNFDAWLFLGMIFMVLHALIFASNLFVVWEDQMTNFFVSSFGLACLFACLVSVRLTSQERILGVSHALTFTVLSRIVAAIAVCREEQLPYCTRTFNTTWWLVILLVIGAIMLPATIKGFYVLNNSYHLAAPVWIGTGFRAMLLMGATYWLAEYMQNSETLLQFDFIVSAPIVSSLKLGIARVLTFVALVVGNIFWYRGPLCVKLLVENLVGEDELPRLKVLGIENVYGLSYFLLVLNFTAAIMLVTKPLGAISLGILLVQVLSALELFKVLRIRRGFLCPVVLGLLGFQHFFSTGHQATIPSIQWETAFMTTQSIVFPFSHLNVFLNTFGSFIIVALCVPLIALWGVGPSKKPISLLAQVITDATSFLTYFLVIGVLSLGFLAHFRRHLMVWKVFAPRFMLSGLLILILNFFVIAVLLVFGTGRIVHQVNRIFGK